MVAWSLLHSGVIAARLVLYSVRPQKLLKIQKRKKGDTYSLIVVDAFHAYIAAV